MNIETLVSLPAADIAADFARNNLVRLALLTRGSKKLFSSESVMNDYLHSLRGNQPPYLLPDTMDFDNRLNLERIGCVNVYTFSPRWISCKKRVLYFCGGAFLREATAQHLNFIDKLAAAARAEISVFCYPKAPTYTYADTYELAARYYARLAAKTGAENIILMGDSAGGSIALALCGFFKELGLPKPAGVAAISPICDLSLSNPALAEKLHSDPILGLDGLRLAARKWCGARELCSPLLNPMDVDVSALPELLLFYGTEDLIAPDIRLFARHIDFCGGKVQCRVYRGMYHAFPLYPLRAAEHAMNEIVQWLNK